MRKSELQDLADRLAGYDGGGWEIVKAKQVLDHEEDGEEVKSVLVWTLVVKKMEVENGGN